MALIVDMYALSVPKFNDLVVHCGGTTTEVDRFFMEEYNASPINGTWDQWQYMMPDQARYVEFCLKWM